MGEGLEKRWAAEGVVHAPDTQRDKNEQYGRKQFPRPRANANPRSEAKVLSTKVKGSTPAS